MPAYDRRNAASAWAMQQPGCIVPLLSTISTLTGSSIDVPAWSRERQ
jgi:hypothetical protein